MLEPQGPIELSAYGAGKAYVLKPQLVETGHVHRKIIEILVLPGLFCRKYISGEMTWVRPKWYRLARLSSLCWRGFHALATTKEQRHLCL